MIKPYSSLKRSRSSGRLWRAFGPIVAATGGHGELTMGHAVRGATRDHHGIGSRPLHGEIVTTTKTYLPTFLATGVHTWTVRAYNETSISDWAAAHSLEITEHKHHIYLPLLLRDP